MTSCAACWPKPRLTRSGPKPDYSPYAHQRDGRIAAALPLRLVDGLTVQPPGAVLKADGTPYTVFTPFSRAWKVRPDGGDPRPAPDHIPTPPDVPGDPIPAEPALAAGVPFPPGEAEAARRLAAFLAAKIGTYGADRDRLDRAGTSSLSPYLRFGMLSARQAVAAARRASGDAPDEAAADGADRWLNELIWREFYVHVLAHFPHVRREAFRPALRDIPWRNDEAEFAAWRDGRTGYPVVDAGMRQLMATGWMHNRARMIMASFLTKDLLVDWRWGEALLHAAPRGWRSGGQQRRLAVGGRDGHGRRALLPRLQPGRCRGASSIRRVITCGAGCRSWRHCPRRPFMRRGNCPRQSNAAGA